MSTDHDQAIEDAIEANLERIANIDTALDPEVIEGEVRAAFWRVVAVAAHRRHGRGGEARAVFKKRFTDLVTKGPP